MKRLFLAVLIATLFTNSALSQKAAGSLPEEKFKDIAYGFFPSSKMDVYLPAGRNAQTPFMIVIHGGAWVLGDKIWGTRTQDTLLAHGMASVNINYRFADDGLIHYPQLLADIDSVLDYCISHADEWQTRKENFILNGESAGAHLALLYGYTTPKKISTIIAECAPTNLADTTVLNYYAKNDPSLLQAICKMAGATYTPGQPAASEFAAASPVYAVKNIPTLFFHGMADPVVPYSQATDLEKKLKNAGYVHQLISIPGAGHDLGLNSPEGRTLIYKEMIDWIRKYGK